MNKNNHIIVILAVDMGYQGCGSYGLDLVPTPQIDSIGAAGGAIRRRLCRRPAVQPEPRRVHDRPLSGANRA